MLMIEIEIDRIGFINCCAADNHINDVIPHKLALTSEFRHNRAQLLIKPGELECGLSLKFQFFPMGF